MNQQNIIQGRKMTPTEIEVVMDRVFGAEFQVTLRETLENMPVSYKNSIQAGCNTVISLKDLEDLAELRERRKKDVAPEVPKTQQN